MKVPFRVLSSWTVKSMNVCKRLLIATVAMITFGLVSHLNLAWCRSETPYDAYIVDRNDTAITCTGLIRPTGMKHLTCVTTSASHRCLQIVTTTITDLETFYFEKHIVGDRCPVDHLTFTTSGWTYDPEQTCSNVAKVTFALVMYLDIMLFAITALLL